MVTARTVKWTTLLILLCLTFFLGSFNATVRILVDQRKQMRPKKSSKQSQQLQTNNNAQSQSSQSQQQPTDASALTDETQKALHEMAKEQLNYQTLKKEQENPTLGKYNSFSRPLDEFSTSTSTKSYQRQSHYHSTPHTNSTQLLADAHFAKALRMVSSPFDRLEGGGNALPPKVHHGNYGQGEARGENFVKMNWNKRRRNKGRKSPSVSSTGASGDNGKVGRGIGSLLRERGEVPLVAFISEIVHEWYIGAMSNLYEILGVDVHHDEHSGGIEEEHNVLSDYASRNEEDVFSWSDTRVGSQLIGIYRRVVGLWWRHPKSEYQSSGSKGETSSSKELLSKEDRIALEGLYHLEKAAELGHAEAQRMVANSLASGILPLSDHSLITRHAKYQYVQSNYTANLTSLLTQSRLEVPDDFSSGGEQLSRAIMLWHLSAMDGNVESAMALGFRHLYSSTGGTTKITSDMDDHISPGYAIHTGGATDVHGTSTTSHYGVLGTCPTALAYYEAAANGVMDYLESGPTKGKVSPPIDEHRLAQIHMHGGASVALDSHNKPDEIEEALQYYRMLASRNRSPEPDLVAAFTVANFYHLGLRGVKQDLRLALKYYEICGDYNHWEGGGLAGLFHVWGIGMTPEERDLGKAYAYFTKGTPGGIDGCLKRMKKKRNAKDKDEEIANCDRHCANGMGLVSLLGIDGLVERNIGNAQKWFEIGKSLGDSDAQYNYAMLRLGWMVTELNDDTYAASSSNPAPTFKHYGISPNPSPFQLNYLVYRRQQNMPHDTSGPSVSDFSVAISDLSLAAAKGHIQAKHKLAMLHATGAEVQKKNGKPTTAVHQSCTSALSYYKSIAESGHTVSQRNRAAWKQYNAGDYESALRNYLATAETGSVAGQLNAAFLLERGYCLGMTTEACTRASIRLWRAAARQGSLEACLRVGDFYYYGRMKKAPAATEPNADIDLFEDKEPMHTKSLEGKALYFAPGPYRWARYILYPEEAVGNAWNWLTLSMKMLRIYMTGQSSGSASTESAVVGTKDSTDTSCSSDDKASGTCEPSSSYDAGKDNTSKMEHDDDVDHMAIAAQYYRKAADDHKSARANFNLGFMYEWGLGLTQDFPLAKRHYDLAGEEADLAASLALFAMGIHEKILKGWVYFNSRYLSN